MTSQLNYSLPITSTLPGTVPPVEPTVPKVASVLVMLFQALDQYKALFARFCGVTTLPVGMWPVLSGDPSTLQIAGNLTRFYCPAAVNVSFGQLITLTLSGGVLKVAVADGSISGKIADGFCSTVGGLAAGSIGEFTLKRGILTLAGPLTVGQRYWLGTAGAVRTTPDTTAGHIEQYIGIAITTTSLFMDSTSWIQH